MIISCTQGRSCSRTSGAFPHTQFFERKISFLTKTIRTYLLHFPPLKLKNVFCTNFVPLNLNPGSTLTICISIIQVCIPTMEAAVFFQALSNSWNTWSMLGRPLCDLATQSTATCNIDRKSSVITSPFSLGSSKSLSGRFPKLASFACETVRKN